MTKVTPPKPEKKPEKTAVEDYQEAMAERNLVAIPVIADIETTNQGKVLLSLTIRVSRGNSKM